MSKPFRSPAAVLLLVLPIMASAQNYKAERLTAHGVEIVERVLPDYGYRQVFFRDPDGNVLELGEWPAVNEMFP